jgi:cytochrome c oxidase subunit 2
MTVAGAGRVGLVLGLVALGLLLAACGDGRVAAPGTPDAMRGARVFSRQGCAGCHLVDGQGGQVGPDLSHIGAVAATRQPGVDAATYLRQSVVEPNAFIVEGYPRDVMPGTYGQTIQPADLADLIAYLLART